MRPSLASTGSHDTSCRHIRVSSIPSDGQTALLALNSRIDYTISHRALAAPDCIPARLHLPDIVQRIATRRLKSEVVLGVG